MRTAGILIGFVLLLPTFLSGGEDEDCVNSFKAIVNKFDDFISTSPIFLISEPFPYSPSGTINYLLKLQKQKLAFDIQRTNSLVTPRVGTITVSLKIESNAEYGDIISGLISHGVWGFKHPEDAEKIQKFSKCASDVDYSEVEWCCGDIQLLYGYQESAWVFKELETEGINRIRMGVIRGAITEYILRDPVFQRAITP